MNKPNLSTSISHHSFIHSFIHPASHPAIYPSSQPASIISLTTPLIPSPLSNKQSHSDPSHSQLLLLYTILHLRLRFLQRLVSQSLENLRLVLILEHERVFRLLLHQHMHLSLTLLLHPYSAQPIATHLSQQHTRNRIHSDRMSTSHAPSSHTHQLIQSRVHRDFPCIQRGFRQHPLQFAGIHASNRNLPFTPSLISTSAASQVTYPFF